MFLCISFIVIMLVSFIVTLLSIGFKYTFTYTPMLQIIISLEGYGHCHIFKLAVWDRYYYGFLAVSLLLELYGQNHTYCIMCNTSSYGRSG